MSFHPTKEQQILTSSSCSRIVGGQAVNNCRDSRFHAPLGGSTLIVLLPRARVFDLIYRSDASVCYCP
jgi:hypothetical protein